MTDKPRISNDILQWDEKGTFARTAAGDVVTVIGKHYYFIPDKGCEDEVRRAKAIWYHVKLGITIMALIVIKLVCDVAYLLPALAGLVLFLWIYSRIAAYFLSSSLEKVPGLKPLRGYERFRGWIEQKPLPFIFVLAVFFLALPAFVSSYFPGVYQAYQQESKIIESLRAEIKNTGLHDEQYLQWHREKGYNDVDLDIKERKDKTYNQDNLRRHKLNQYRYINVLVINAIGVIVLLWAGFYSLILGFRKIKL